VADDGEPGAALVIRQHDGPRGVFRVRALDHQVAHGRVIVPLLHAGHIHGRELPALERTVTAVVEALELRFPADIEPELEKVCAVIDDDALEVRRFIEEVPVLFRRTETHDWLHGAAIVPGAIEGDELAGSREMRDVALIVPLAALGLGGFR